MQPPQEDPKTPNQDSTSPVQTSPVDIKSESDVKTEIKSEDDGALRTEMHAAIGIETVPDAQSASASDAMPVFTAATVGGNRADSGGTADSADLSASAIDAAQNGADASWFT